MSNADAIPVIGRNQETRLSAVDFRAIVLLVLITLVVLARVCFSQFTAWDDHSSIEFNPAFLPPTVASIAHQWTAPTAYLFFPVTQTLWGLISWATQTTNSSGQLVQIPWPFHAVNLMVHVAAVVIVFHLLRLLKFGTFPSICGALLFAVHPIQVKSVAWASGLKDVLAGALCLVALQQYLLYSGEPQSARRQAHYAWAFTAFAAAMLAKSSAITLPLSVAGVDLLARRRPWKNVLQSLWPWLLAALPIAIIARLVQNVSGIPKLPLWTRPFIVRDALAFYLSKLAWPTHLAIDYGHSPVHVLAAGYCYWDWIIPATIGVLLYAGRRNRPVLLLSGLLFVFGCAPVLGFTPSGFSFASTTADHYLYLSMLGPSLALAWLLTAYQKTLLRAITLAILFAFGVRSFQQAAYWTDDAAFWPHELAENPNSWLAQFSFGAAYEERGDYVHAAARSRRAIELSSGYPALEDRARQQLSEVLQKADRLDDAIVEKRRLVAFDRDVPILHFQWAQHTAELGQLLCGARRYFEAVPYLEIAHEIAPDAPKVARLLRFASEQSISSPATQPLTKTNRTE